MKKTLLLFMALAAALSCAAQDPFVLTGVVRDKATGAHLIDAMVMLYDENDSLVSCDTAHDWDWDDRRRAQVETARFRLYTPRKKAVYQMKIACEEYDTLTQRVDVSNMGKRELSRDIGTYYLTRAKTVNLDEVTVTATKIMFYNRGDTVVYNADAFQLAEGSMLDELIKQLPGVELKEGGEIFVNGKKVSSLLLNGKDLFRGDNQVMLDNLSAYMVKNIEVYKKQTDRAKFLGLTDEDNKELVMDVKIKKEYIGGWTVNTEAGGGTEERYMGRLFGLHFNALSQFTIVGNLNNLNDSRRPTNDSSWEPEYRPSGTKRFKETGMNYSTENDEGSRKANGSVSVRSEGTDYRYRQNSLNFLQTMNTQSRSTGLSFSDNFTVSTDHELLWQNTWLSLKAAPKFEYRHGSSNSNSSSITMRDGIDSQSLLAPDVLHAPDALPHGVFAGMRQPAVPSDGIAGLINQSLSQSHSSTDHVSVGGRVSASIKIPRTSDAIDLYASMTHDNDRSTSNSLSIINYGDAATPSSARNQQTLGKPQHSNAASAGAVYLLRFSDKLMLHLKGNYNFTRQSRTSSFYLGQLMAGHTDDCTLDSLRGVERSFDPTNSYTSVETASVGALSPQLTWIPMQRLNIGVAVPVQAVSNNLDYQQNGKGYHASFCKTMLNDVNARVDWSRYDSISYSSVQLSYAMTNRAPSLRNMIEPENTTNPLVRSLGNPDLTHETTHNFSLYAYTIRNNKYNMQGQLNYMREHGSSVSGRTYDTSTGRTTYKVYNINGQWRMTAQLSMTYTLSKVFRISPSFWYTHNIEYDMVGENSLVPKKMRAVFDRYSPNLQIGATISPKVFLELRSSCTWNRNSSENPNAQNLNHHSLNNTLSGKFTMPHGWSLNTSLALYKRGGYDDSKMNITEWVWNGSVKKSLCKGKLLCSLTAYDMLHQISNAYYYVTPNGRYESFANTIPRYALLHCQYKLNIKPKRKLAETVTYY